MAEQWQREGGDRVRVRDGLAGACRETRSQVPQPNAPGLHAGLLKAVEGHRPREAGSVGTAVPLVSTQDPERDHDIPVRFDSPVRPGAVPGWAQLREYTYCKASGLGPLGS